MTMRDFYNYEMYVTPLGYRQPVPFDTGPHNWEDMAEWEKTLLNDNWWYQLLSHESPQARSGRREFDTARDWARFCCSYSTVDGVLFQTFVSTVFNLPEDPFKAEQSAVYNTSNGDTGFGDPDDWERAKPHRVFDAVVARVLECISKGVVKQENYSAVLLFELGTLDTGLGLLRPKITGANVLHVIRMVYERHPVKSIEAFIDSDIDATLSRALFQ
jgi:hypothetical protein